MVERSPAVGASTNRVERGAEVNPCLKGKGRLDMSNQGIKARIDRSISKSTEVSTIAMRSKDVLKST
jgi:hypothetical protein